MTFGQKPAKQDSLFQNPRGEVVGGMVNSGPSWDISEALEGALGAGEI
jgi:hypothetical protein